MTSQGTLLVGRDGAIVTVTVNRPESLNALNRATVHALSEAFDELSGDDDVRCIVLRGAGDRAFGVGADIKEFDAARADPDQARAYDANWGTGLARCRHPVIAMIKGYCVGGSLGLIPYCDLRIAGVSARFAVPAGKLGLTYSHDEIANLARLVGFAGALEFLLEGEMIPADRALQMGLVNRVLPDEDVEQETYATARRIAERAPLAARWHKKFVRRLCDPAPLSDAERDEAYLCYDTDDYRIGREAFVAKQKPVFKGS
jgi:enoyl-CoA hydratase/carnithine racemase